MTEKRVDYSWKNTFEDLKYQAKKNGQDETQFSTCRKCLTEGLEDFDEKEMVRQSKAFEITLYFIPCEKHDGVTV